MKDFPEILRPIPRRLLFHGCAFGKLIVLEPTTNILPKPRLPLFRIAVWSRSRPAALGTLQIEADFDERSARRIGADTAKRMVISSPMWVRRMLSSRTLSNTPAGDFTVRVFNPQNSVLIEKLRAH